ncbi:hypothetical protein [Desulfosporosinus sp. BG]|uniref:hypothetical protein n=1 Tax=Desulfosporosinus sp. BG TaxID=1633135 RepID=UPI00083B437F|nr:hypothetical protein [Desulfosporosinus sp. BG]ODA41440.1 hypothetical protein DSBG_1716 [Desulfosporosinus sp. BG]
MPLLTRPRNPTFPAGIPHRCFEPKSPQTYDYGFKRFAPLLQSPPVGAGILAITLFYFIAFFSNVLLAPVSFTTLGITVTIGTFGLLALVVLILFLF